MNFEFSPEQMQLKEEARRVLADLSPAAPSSLVSQWPNSLGNRGRRAS